MSTKKDGDDKKKTDDEFQAVVSASSPKYIEAHVKGLKRGKVEEWNKAKSGGNFKGKTRVADINTLLKGTDLVGANLSGIDLEGLDLSNVNFSGSNLAGARFSQCVLNGTILSSANLTMADLQGCQMQNADFSNANLTSANLSECRIQSGKFSGANMESASLAAARVDGTSFTDMRADDADLIKGEFVDCEFSRANLNEARLSSAKLSQPVFTRARLRNASFENIEVTRGQFDDIVANAICMRAGQFDDCNFENANLSAADLSNSAFRGASSLNRAVIEASKLEGASFTDCDLRDANLRGASTNQQTSFANANVTGCEIDRYSLECLGDYGGLSSGARMRMRINDDVARLRTAYSGFWQWFHIIALVLFLAPYVWFIALKWNLSKFNLDTSTDKIALWQALARYIFNGGVDWERGYAFHYSFVLFCLLLAYNLLRAFLLAKTKNLELEQTSSGHPADFSFTDTLFWRIRWGNLFSLAQFGFYVNITIVLFNVAHFMQKEIPINP